MANTPKGYPYPLGTDRVMDGDDAIKALAEKIDAALGVSASGVTSIDTPASGQGSTAVTYPAGRFTVAPKVFIQLTGTSSTIGAGVPTTTNTGSTTGFTANYRRDTAATFAFHWFAVQH